MGIETLKSVCVLVIIHLTFDNCECSVGCNVTQCNYPTECINGKCMCRLGFDKVNCTSGSDVCYCQNGDDCIYGNCSCTHEQTFACKMFPLCGNESEMACKDGGTCVINGSDSFCICPENLNKTDCTPNRCELGKPCIEGECISRGNNDYDCRCEDGSVGKICGLNKKCIDGFCANGGTCYENEYVRCRCMEGYTGPRCEENTMKHVCDKFGTTRIFLQNSTNETECTCRDLFKGKSCDLLNCEVSNPCQNGGLCYSDPSAAQKFFCYCPKGWDNNDCSRDIDECLWTPCGANGTCKNINGSYECFCQDNSTRKTCEKNLPNCLHSERCSLVARDGVCQADCNSRHCDFDGGDCITENPWMKCTSLPKGYCRSLSTNGKCDEECNNENCLFDLFDCNHVATDRCPEHCIQSWGDGLCQSECSAAECGYDGADCQADGIGDIINGTIVITYFSATSDAFKTIGSVSSIYSGAILSFMGQTSPIVRLEPGGPSHLLQEEATKIQFAAFFAVKNTTNCSMCWTNTESLSNYLAALYINNASLFQHNMTQITIKNFRACEAGFYGEHCDNPCPATCNGTRMCSMVNGSCLNGCTIGYYGMKCENMCSSTCAEGCGLDGNCTGGKCKSGYSGPTCLDECPIGKFGLYCIQDCNDKCESGKCNKVDGSCTCKAGYTGSNCSNECEDGKYGVNCVYSCGNCAKGDPCDHVNGTCPMGCKTGYDGRKCNDCTKGTYGDGCKMACSNCLNDDCNIDGSCKQGCKKGYSGTTCIKAQKSTDGDGSATSSTIVAVIIILVILIIVGVAVACILWRKDQKGSYVLGEKKQDDTPMKTLPEADEEDLVKTNGETEPLVAVTPTDKNFHEAKLIIETECVDLDHKEGKGSDLYLTEDKRQSNATKSTRSSRGSDFRPESIHGNGPGGVYVGGSPPLEISSGSNRNSNESGKSSSSSKRDSSKSGNSDGRDNTEKSKESEKSRNSKSVENSENEQKETTEKFDVTTEDTVSTNQNNSDPITTTDKNGVQNTDGL